MKEEVKHNLADIYTDYLMISTSLCMATGLSDLTGGTISHDKITRLLNSDGFNSREV